MTPVEIGVENLTLADVVDVARNDRRVSFAKTAKTKVQLANQEVRNLISASSSRVAYGINTGFGALAEVRISHDKVRELQKNLIRSHAAGVGEFLPEDAVRAMILLRAHTLALGYSGCRPEVIEQLIALLEKKVHPCIPSQGSVGASGDLAPLAHLALVLIGEGSAHVGEKILSGEDALREVGLSPLDLEAKEGLSLINGTQLMTAIGALALWDSIELAKVADIAGGLSLEALLGTPVAFDQRIQEVRAHPGQLDSAENLRCLTKESPLVSSHKDCHKVQDPYSLRCMPQVHGAARDAIGHAWQVIERELGAATDNPLVFVEKGKEATILSGGNFHGQPVALALDYAKLGVLSLGAISERRIEQLMNPKLSSGLPPFLSKESGLHSGLMMAHVTAASLVSESKVLAHPASADSIPTSAAREDHVSMGSIASRHFYQVVSYIRQVIAIELFSAAQACDLRAPITPSPAGEALLLLLRKHVPTLKKDRVLSTEIQCIDRLIQSGDVRRCVEEKIGKLQ